MNRVVVPVSGGTFDGPRLKETVVGPTRLRPTSTACRSDQIQDHPAVRGERHYEAEHAAQDYGGDLAVLTRGSRSAVSPPTFFCDACRRLGPHRIHLDSLDPRRLERQNAPGVFHENRVKRTFGHACTAKPWMN